MKKRVFCLLLVPLSCCFMALFSSCKLDNTKTEYSRRMLKNEIGQYFNNEYIGRAIWIDSNNCLFAFSPLSISEVNKEGHHKVYRYSVNNDEVDLIFDDELDGYFSNDESFYRVVNGNVLLVVGNSLLYFDSNYNYIKDKGIILEDGVFVCLSNDGQKAVILLNDKLYCANVESINNTIKAFDRYYGYLGNICFSADGNKIFQSVGTPEKTTIIDVFDIQTQTISHLTCLDSLSEDDYVGIGLLYPYDETHIMLRINGAEFTNFHDTYVLVDYTNDTCEVIHRSSSISEFSLDNASGTWELEKGEKIRVNIYPFNDKKISVELEEPLSNYGSTVWIDTYDYSFIYLNRISDNECNISVYIRDLEKL